MKSNTNQIENVQGKSGIGLFEGQIELKNQTKAVAVLQPSVKKVNNGTENYGMKVSLIVNGEKFTKVVILSVFQEVNIKLMHIEGSMI